MKDLLQELDARIRNLEELPHPQVREEIFTVLQLIDRVHRPGLGQLAERLKEAGLWQAVLSDENLAVLFTLYDLVPLDESSQVEQALEAVRPYLRSHGGEVEVLEVTEGEVHLRLRGSCGSCAASAATLEHGVEAALKEGFPGFRRLIVHEPEDHSALVQLRAPVFRDLLALADLADRSPAVVELEDKSVLVVRLGGEVYAFDSACAGCGTSLEGSQVSGHVLVCPISNCAFDVRSGRRVDGGEGPGLRVYPVTTEEGRVLLAGDMAPTALFA